MSTTSIRKNRAQPVSRTRRQASRAIALPAITVPDRIVPMLGAGVAALFALYVVLVVTTIFFATLQTRLAHSMEETRTDIDRLEAQYYDAIARIDATDPASIGLVSPQAITYVTAARDTNLTLAR